MSRVLVTGATGFIGRGTLAPLVAAGHEVHAVSTRPAPASSYDGVAWHQADLLTDPEAVIVRARPDVLVHLAWYTEHGRFWTAPENVRWVEASLALLRAFATAGGRRAVLAGTCAEYDWTTEAPTLVERVSPLAPATLYGHAKAGLHEVAAGYAEQAGFELAWGRVFFGYGPGEADGRLVPSVARALLAGEIAKTTAGTQVRDFMHVDDIAGAFCALATSAVTGPVNVASGVPVTIREVVDAVAAAVGSGPDSVDAGAIPQRSGEPERIVADARRLREEIGFTPRYDLATGARQTVDALRGRSRS
ncbi:MAG: NAD(P)-dependent oxidoreductase [Solirubrobacterales bacterium]|nr:NAD(P)-dependent oxidoreductase [Solirubrobacterales bacterium]